MFMRPPKIEPQPGQESVWDYPRPPRLEPSSEQIQVVFNGQTVADTRRAFRVLETSHPPVYYLPPEDIKMEYFSRTPRSSFCEFKGNATYWSIQVGERAALNVAWSYESPTPDFAAIRGYIAVYPGRMDACYINGEQVQAQAGDFYGGWITSKIVGPFKGEAGTWGW
ncbi:hypothetical protein AVDCRST_MAG81-120 [uncultured Synechococcales cyanobacterium]|uniref:DUF427 domain-containing protein n=1 Tax=uncultured Synechococcales cyanobacterium TaxID=1936017 RepID=A0A6J4ULX3_9CYAN|nr:hypothetical protein AVDCRST_MAG81-120 [uncultured Synechococcales cyanobacterium]